MRAGWVSSGTQVGQGCQNGLVLREAENLSWSHIGAPGPWWTHGRREAQMNVLWVFSAAKHAASVCV